MSRYQRLPGMPPDEWTTHPEQRVSGLAVASLVCGLLCCIPGVGAVAAVLGVGGLMGISKSQGRITGSGFAATGIALGVISTIVWIGGAITARNLTNAVRYRMFDPMVAFGEQLQQGDTAKARSYLSPNAKVSDEQLAAFAGKVQSSLGPWKGITQDGSLWQNFGQRAKKHEKTVDLATRSGQHPIPLFLPLAFEKGEAMVIPFTDSPEFMTDWLWQNKSLEGNIVNMLVISPDGQEIWLVPPPVAAGTPPGSLPTSDSKSRNDPVEADPPPQPPSPEAPEKPR